jgi:hypothetical protein
MLSLQNHESKHRRRPEWLGKWESSPFPYFSPYLFSAFLSPSYPSQFSSQSYSSSHPSLNPLSLLPPYRFLSPSLLALNLLPRILQLLTACSCLTVLQKLKSGNVFFNRIDSFWLENNCYGSLKFDTENAPNSPTSI